LPYARLVRYLEKAIFGLVVVFAQSDIILIQSVAVVFVDKEIRDNGFKLKGCRSGNRAAAYVDLYACFIDIGAEFIVGLSSQKLIYRNAKDFSLYVPKGIEKSENVSNLLKIKKILRLKGKSLPKTTGIP